MKKRLLLAATAGLSLLAAAPMQAGNVKAGVDAWARGDYKKAVDQWRGPAVSGDADAQFNLGQAYKLGRGVPVDLAMAEEWYRKAALQNHPQAEDNYGLALFQNGKRADAIRWLEKSAARGEARSQFVLGTMLFNGDAIAKDWVRAYALMVRANAAGLPQGSQTLAQMDKYIGLADRQKGLVLARQYESQMARAPSLAVADAPTGPAAMARADVPASRPAPPPAAAKPAPAPARPTVASAPPAPKPAAPAPAAPRTSGDWRIQLGAFRDEGNARSLWGKVSGISGLAGTKPYYVKSGAVTRVLVGPFGSSAEATRACAAVKRTGQACLPTKG
ncbi:SPOR domain-containing protein [Sphingomonas qomolangmaensis]|uniref:SPOR domain-containing protein n=1 Tax=Sphingomonas qomolangmaensis TaxID=2918765 RepID=A0ABY5LBH1_9SPHN|nr:SPOR domain-containing protein [Sphingomonas qomolangmaensis]UUL83752.1 SPOR domain-containing protein [Sphingomonas qomolangmaensis]